MADLKEERKLWGNKITPLTSSQRHPFIPESAVAIATDIKNVCRTFHVSVRGIGKTGR